MPGQLFQHVLRERREDRDPAQEIQLGSGHGRSVVHLPQLATTPRAPPPGGSLRAATSAPCGPKTPTSSGAAAEPTARPEHHQGLLQTEHAGENIIGNGPLEQGPRRHIEERPPCPAEQEQRGRAAEPHGAEPRGRQGKAADEQAQLHRRA